VQVQSRPTPPADSGRWAEKVPPNVINGAHRNLNLGRACCRKKLGKVNKFNLIGGESSAPCYLLCSRIARFRASKKLSVPASHRIAVAPRSAAGHDPQDDDGECILSRRPPEQRHFAVGRPVPLNYFVAVLQRRPVVDQDLVAPWSVEGENYRQGEPLARAWGGRAPTATTRLQSDNPIAPYGCLSSR